MFNWLRRLSHHEKIVAAARAVGLAAPLKRVYYDIASNPEQVFRAKLAGVAVNFYATGATELRMLEDLEAGKNECFFSSLATELKPGDVFYDIGSNIGEYALFAGKMVGPQGSVVAFEPVRETFDRLQENIKLNQLSNVRAIRAALSDRTHQGTLIVSGFRSRKSRLKESADQVQLTGKEEVIEIFKGDDICATEHLAVPSVVKIDVEGFEYSVLEGLASTLGQDRCRFLCCEIHPGILPTGVTVDAILGAVRSLGFQNQECVRRGTEMHLIATKSGAVARTSQHGSGSAGP